MEHKQLPGMEQEHDVVEDGPAHFERSAPGGNNPLKHSHGVSWSDILGFQQVFD